MHPSFYGPIQAQSYDTGDNPPEIIAFYLAEWRRLGQPSPVLEPMCGTGLNLLPFLQAGARCDGLDSSPDMLARCQAHLDRAGLTSTLYRQDLTALDLGQAYGFIFIPGGSFGHIDDKDVAAQCLMRLAAHLLPGGWLVFDVRPPSRIHTFGAPGQIDHSLQEFPDGSTIVATGRWDHLDHGRVIRKWVTLERFVAGSLQATEIFDYRERLYDQDELLADLHRVGFRTIHLTTSYLHGREPSPSDSFVVSCQKEALAVPQHPDHGNG